MLVEQAAMMKGYRGRGEDRREEDVTSDLWVIIFALGMIDAINNAMIMHTSSVFQTCS